MTGRKNNIYDQKPDWQWVEAFYKFGFDDGDGHIETARVTGLLEDVGFLTDVFEWRPHNTIIVSIKNKDIEYMPIHSPAVLIGYHDPHDYLPDFIINLLDEKFPPTKRFAFPLKPEILERQFDMRY